MTSNEFAVVLATHNQGKARELSSLLAAKGVKVLTLGDFPQIGEIEENGTTFAENALIKARTVCAATGLVAIADDSGLMVDALNGAPGIYSARFGEDWEYLPQETQDQRNIRKLLAVMKDQRNRSCRFVTAIAAVRPDGAELVTEGTWEGNVLPSPRGKNGFGYDPVFFDEQLGMAAAELSPAEKNSHSHRGKALRNLLAHWDGFMTS